MPKASRRCSTPSARRPRAGCRPAEDYTRRPWARLAGVNFARFAAERGVIVLNDPDALLRNVNKLSLEHYPAEIRPRSVISRDLDEIRAFVEERDEPSVLKPLAGSGGRNVFFVRREDHPNLKQMVAAILRASCWRRRRCPRPPTATSG